MNLVTPDAPSVSSIVTTRKIRLFGRLQRTPNDKFGTVFRLLAGFRIDQHRLVLNISHQPVGIFQRIACLRKKRRFIVLRASSKKILG